MTCQVSEPENFVTLRNVVGGLAIHPSGPWPQVVSPLIEYGRYDPVKSTGRLRTNAQ